MKKKQTIIRSQEQILLDIHDAVRQLVVLMTNAELKETEFYDNADMKRIFHMSDSTLSRRRKSGELPFKKIRGKIYHPKSFFTKAFKF